MQQTSGKLCPLSMVQQLQFTVRALMKKEFLNLSIWSISTQTEINDLEHKKGENDNHKSITMCHDIELVSS